MRLVPPKKKALFAFPEDGSSGEPVCGDDWDAVPRSWTAGGPNARARTQGLVERVESADGAVATAVAPSVGRRGVAGRSERDVAPTAPPPPGVPALQQSQRRAQWARRRPAALQMPCLPEELQRPDRHPAGAPAPAREVVGPSPGAELGPERAPGRWADERAPHHGLSLAPPLPGLAPCPQGLFAARR